MQLIMGGTPSWSYPTFEEMNAERGEVIEPSNAFYSIKLKLLVLSVDLAERKRTRRLSLDSPLLSHLGLFLLKRLRHSRAPTTVR